MNQPNFLELENEVIFVDKKADAARRKKRQKRW